MVGGTLGLFPGMSILSFVEIICFCLNINKRLASSGTKDICYKKSFSVADKNKFEKEVQNYVREFLAENIQKTTLTQSNLHDKGQKELSMNYDFN